MLEKPNEPKQISKGNTGGLWNIKSKLKFMTAKLNVNVNQEN